MQKEELNGVTFFYDSCRDENLDVEYYFFPNNHHHGIVNEIDLFALRKKIYIGNFNIKNSFIYSCQNGKEFISSYEIYSFLDDPGYLIEIKVSDNKLKIKNKVNFNEDPSKDINVSSIRSFLNALGKIRSDKKINPMTIIISIEVMPMKITN